MSLSNTLNQYSNDKHANYQLVQGNIVTQSEWSNSIAFNKEQNIMVAGCDKKIKVFEFQNGQLKQIQVLSECTGEVIALYFLSSNEFISGSYDQSIRIWCINNLQQWYCKQLLEDGVLMHRNEDQFITYSPNERIKFWTKKNEWECSQTLTSHAVWVFSLSLNDSQTQLVVCEEEKQISIYQQEANKIWKKIQTIKVEADGFRICFIGDTLFTFQPQNKEKMLIFELNQEVKLFNKVKEVKVETSEYCSTFFPQEFNKQMQILVNKNGDTVHLMRKLNGADFVIDQILKFETEHIFGKMSDDGEYLVTWDRNSKQFQVRKQQH